MSVCTFFGHRDCPEDVKTRLCEILTDLIENHSADLFYVGRQGSFDRIVRSVLRELAEKYPHIRYAVVAERLPGKRSASQPDDDGDTVLPEGIEKVPPRFAVSWRNKWMLRRSDYVVTYVTHSWGGAAKFAEMARKQKKTVIGVFPEDGFPE